MRAALGGAAKVCSMFRPGVALISVFILLAGETHAQKKPDANVKTPAAAKSEPAKVPPAQPAKPSEKKNAATGTAQASAIPDNFKINMMIRSTVIAVNQANKTNNYTVLRDLGSVDFRVANSAEKLALIFSGLRKSGFDLSPVLFFTPKLLKPPALTESGMLRLHGFFDTRPQIVAFDLLFQRVQGEWQLFGISISTRPVPADAPKGAGSPAADAKGAASPKAAKQSPSEKATDNKGGKGASPPASAKLPSAKPAETSKN
jgi:hypothetical protein